MITKEIIKKNLKEGLIEIVNGSFENGTDGIVCKIGDNQFYFDDNAGSDQYKNAEEYLKAVPLDKTVDDIYEALNEIRDEIDEEEYKYYELYLDCYEGNYEKEDI